MFKWLAPLFRSREGRSSDGKLPDDTGPQAPDSPLEPKILATDAPNGMSKAQRDSPPSRPATPVVVTSPERGNLPTPRDLPVVFGIDFGTASTKRVIRMPYEAGEPAFAVPVPRDCRAEAHPHLWQSRLWLRRDETYSLECDESGALLTGLKAALMANTILPHESRQAVTPIEAVAAFLALQVRQGRAWYESDEGRAPKNRALSWEYNFGFPAASLTDSALAARYRHCIAAALDLALGDGEVSRVTVGAALARVKLAGGLASRGAALFPEIAGAVAGFARSQSRSDGLYAMVDVGAGTLDCCTFNLYQPIRPGGWKDEDRCPIFRAAVGMYGVEAWRACQNDHAAEDQLRDKMDVLMRGVIWRTFKCGYPSSPCWTESLPLFLVGGGAGTEPYVDRTRALHVWLRKQLATGKGGVRVIALPVPERIKHQCDAKQLHRLAVAVGLSWPGDTIPRVELPDPRNDVPEPVVRDVSDAFVDQSMT